MIPTEPPIIMDESALEKNETKQVVEYFFSPSLKAFKNLAIERLKRGLGCTLFLEGPPGGGKTSFAKECARELNAPCSIIVALRIRSEICCTK